MRVFATIMTEPAVQARQTETAMIDATHLKAHRTASSLAVEKGGALQTGDGRGGRGISDQLLNFSD